MTATNTIRTYGSVTRTFHWLTALGILLLIPMGGIANRLPYETSEQLARKAWLFSAHKSLGVIVFLLALGRILWALSQVKPGSLHPERRLETLAAETVHWVLYGSLVIVPLSGWIHHAATTGFAPLWFGVGDSLPLVPKSDAVAGWFGALHFVTTKILIGALVLHIAGALKHHFVDRDLTLRRMWFGRTAIPDIPPHRSPALAPLIAVAAFLIAGGAASALTGQHQTAAASVPALEEATSEWEVTDGTLSITVTQFGNPVTGSFADWTAAIAFDPDAGPEYGSVEVTVAPGSLTIGSVTDQALGPDFLAVEEYPTATFTGPIVADGDRYRVDGTLSLKGESQPLSLPFTLDLDGDTARAEGATSLDRMDFDVGTSQADETNLGFGVDVTVSLTATRNGN